MRALEQPDDQDAEQRKTDAQYGDEGENLRWAEIVSEQEFGGSPEKVEQWLRDRNARQRRHVERA
jgi:hypothetical protein